MLLFLEYLELDLLAWHVHKQCLIVAAFFRERGKNLIDVALWIDRCKLSKSVLRYVSASACDLLHTVGIFKSNFAFFQLIRALYSFPIVYLSILDV